MRIYYCGWSERRGSQRGRSLLLNAVRALFGTSEEQAPQSGEITLTLTIFSLIVIMAGTVIGTQQVVKDTVQKYLSHGQTSCSYHAKAIVYQDRVGGSLLSSNEMTGGVWGVSNNKQNQNSPAGVFTSESSFDYAVDDLKFKDQGGTYTSGETADVTVFGPVEPGFSSGDWEITNTFCNQAPGSLVPCPNVSSQQTSQTIKGFSVSCGANIEYGWVVRRKVTGSCQLSSSSTCLPRNVKAVVKDNNEVNITWKSPENCPSFNRHSDSYWLDVVDSHNRIVCSGSSTNEADTCKLGRDRERAIDNPISKWEEDATYFANVYTHNSQSSTGGACVGGPVSASFVYTKIVPTDVPQPTSEVQPTTPPVGPTAIPPTSGPAPTGKPYCSKKTCVYQDGSNGCAVGNCLDNSETCSDNVHCGFVPGCTRTRPAQCPGPQYPTTDPNQPPATPFPTNDDDINALVKTIQDHCGGENNYADHKCISGLKGLINQEVYGYLHYTTSKTRYNPTQCGDYVNAIKKMKNDVWKSTGAGYAINYANKKFWPAEYSLIENPCYKDNDCKKSIPPVAVGDVPIWDVFTAGHMAYTTNPSSGDLFSVTEANLGGPGLVRFQDKSLRDPDLKGWLHHGTQGFVAQISDESKNVFSILSVTPDMSAEGVNSRTTITYTFDKPVTKNDIKFSILPETPFNQQIVGNKLTISFIQPLISNAIYLHRVSFPNIKQDETVYDFTTAGTGEIIFPNIAPLDGGKSMEEALKKSNPDAYLNGFTPFGNDLFSATATPSEKPTYHYVFTFTVKTAKIEQAIAAIKTWIASHGITDTQVEQLTVMFVPQPINSQNGANYCDNNNDGVCNTIDYGRCITSYGRKTTGFDFHRCDSDLNHTLNALDLSIILQNLGQKAN